MPGHRLRFLSFVLASSVAHGACLVVWSSDEAAASRYALGESTISVRLSPLDQHEQAGRQLHKTRDADRYQARRAAAVTRNEPGRAPLGARTAAAANPDTEHRPSNGEPEKQASAVQRNALLGEIQTRLSRYLSYPPRARREGWQGRVLLAFNIESDGRIGAIHIAQSSGYGILDRSALESLQKIERVSGTGLSSGSLTNLRLPVTYRLTEN
jgi:TonB family protein